MAHPLSGKTLLVTGGCGYLGSVLVRHLAATGAEGLRIRILDNLQTPWVQALWDLPDGAEYEFFEGDLLDATAVQLATEGVHGVVHLAALVRSPFSFDNPRWLEQVNHWGTAHLVNACVAERVELLVFASTTAVYGPGKGMREGDPCRPLGPYAQSKYRAENAVLAARDRGVRGCVLRFGSFFGAAPVTRFDTVVNHLTYLAGVRRSLTIHGEGSQRRPVIHVADAAEVVRFVLESPVPEVPAVLNAVTFNPSVLEVATEIQMQRPEVSCHYTEQDVLTHLSLAVDNQALLDSGWEPRYDLRQGVDDLLHRFQAFTSPNYLRK